MEQPIVSANATPPVSLLPSPLPSRPINPTPSLQYKDSRRQRRTSMYRL